MSLVAESPTRGTRAASFAPLPSKEFDTIAGIILDDAGIYLPREKSSLVTARLGKRLRHLNMSSFSQYCALVTSPEGAGERRNMLSALTTNVTSFFRERHHFEHMQAVSLPPLLKRAREGGRVRIWSAGCSSGQEPYSIAFTILKMEPTAASLDIKILATDIDPAIVQVGVKGFYQQREILEIPEEQRTRWMRPVKDGTRSFTVSEEARRIVTFRELNLNGAWPMSRPFDVVFCRNVVIYFDRATQTAVWSNFAQVINPEGWLYIGHSERVYGPAEAAFQSAGATTYRRR